MSIVQEEWIGKHIKIIKAANKSQQGIEGIVVDETRNTIIVETAKGNKCVQKYGSVISINGEEVDGKDVLALPEERIKLKVNK